MPMSNPAIRRRAPSLRGSHEHRAGRRDAAARTLETADGKRPLPSGPYYDLASWHRINRLYTPQVLAELRSTMRVARFPERVEKMISVIRNREGHRLASSVEAAKIALTDVSSSFAMEQIKYTTALPLDYALITDDDK